LFRFVIESHSFRRISVLTIVIVILLYFTNKIFDHYWTSMSSIPLVNLNIVYAPPKEYDDVTKINLQLVKEDLVVIEGNRRFKLMNSGKDYSYFDTIPILRPDTVYNYFNKIFLSFENSVAADSIYLVVSKSIENNKFYNQVFYSSVIVNSLNELSEKQDNFRIDLLALVEPSLLNNNDTLIYAAFKYFNDNASKLGLAECGTNCLVFMKICESFKVPCRMVWLQGGDIEKAGFDNSLGYPLHVVCEIYYAKQKKWYVVDPSYGIRFKNNDNDSYMSAVELSVLHTFRNANDIEQDSVLVVKKNIVGKDYFKYYENVMFGNIWVKNFIFKKFLAFAYPKFNHRSSLYSNNYPQKKDGYFYFGLKTILYFVIIIIYINAILFVLAKRLFSAKKP
jgi:hypothetical protein